MNNAVTQRWAWLKRKSFNWVLRATVKPLWSRRDLTPHELQRLLDQACNWLPIAGRAPGRPERVNAHLLAEWFELARVAPRVLLYLHGGAWITHAPALYRSLARRLAQTLQARVLMPEYRLAPAWRFPAGSDDALAAYKHLLDSGVPPGQIVIGGDSAGGNLALVTLIRARDEGLPLPACGFVFSPVTDLTFSSASSHRNQLSDVMFTLPAGTFVGTAYLDDMGQLQHPWVSPLYADLHGLPPLLLQASDSEMLADDARRFAECVRAAGGRAEFSSWHDLPHVFQMAGFLTEAAAALQEVHRFVHRVFDNQPRETET